MVFTAYHVTGIHVMNSPKARIFLDLKGGSRFRGHHITVQNWISNGATPYTPNTAKKNSKRNSLSVICGPISIYFQPHAIGTKANWFGAPLGDARYNRGCALCQEHSFLSCCTQRSRGRCSSSNFSIVMDEP